MTDVDIKIENIVASASIGKDIVLTEVAKALEGVDFNREQFPGLVFKLQDPKTAALIFSSGKLVCTGAKSIDDSKLAIKKTVDLMRTIDTGFCKFTIYFKFRSSCFGIGKHWIRTRTIPWFSIPFIWS